MELKLVPMSIPEGTNIIIGQTHFIKTAEDMHELVVNTVPQAKFGIAFNEASGPCLVRSEGNDAALKETAIENAMAIGAGHVFVMLIRDAYPVNLLERIKDCWEVCSVFCATANPAQVVVAETEQGRGVLGVIDGFLPKGREGEADIKERREFLRKIGYKF
jgi:adenosine/AMP kinase